jgi:hypothetical protein
MSERSSIKAESNRARAGRNGTRLRVSLVVLLIHQFSMTTLLRAFVIGAVFRAISVTCLMPQADPTLASTLPGTGAHDHIRRRLPIISIDADCFSARESAIHLNAHPSSHAPFSVSPSIDQSTK